jgi:quinol monooxygenase YgiN
MRVVLEAKIREESVEDAKAFFKRVLPDARVYKGCICSKLYQSNIEPTCLLMVEDWETEAHHKQYLASCIKTGVLKEMLRLLSGPPSLKYYTTIEI